MKLYAHQQKILNDFPQRHLLAFGTGTGKTLVGILLANKVGGKALFVVPKGLKTNWSIELHKHCTIPHTLVTKEQMRKDWDTIGYHDTIVYDEAHHTFGMTSSMSRELRKFLKKYEVPHRYFMTATPYRSTPWNIFVAASLLDIPNRRLSYPVFEKTFFFKVKMGHRYIPMARKGMEDDLADIVNKIGSTINLEDCADVPQQTFEVEYFSLTCRQKQAMLDVDMETPLVKYTRQHQICGGTLKGNEYEEDRVIGSDKVDRVVSLAEENRKLIVVCRYNNELEMLKEELEKKKIPVYIISGHVDQGAVIEKLKTLDRYVLLAQAKTCTGWELKECAVMCFYSLDFGLIEYLQALGRIQRIDSVKKNTYIHLVTRGTVDEKVYQRVAVERKDFHMRLMNYEK